MLYQSAPGMKTKRIENIKIKNSNSYSGLINALKNYSYWSRAWLNLPFEHQQGILYSSIFSYNIVNPVFRNSIGAHPSQITTLVSKMNRRRRAHKPNSSEFQTKPKTNLILHFEKIFMKRCPF